MDNPSMYLLLFKKPSEEQVEFIRNHFKDFSWSPGLYVEDVVLDEVINDNLLIQFVSSKEFCKINNDKISLISDTIGVLTDKGNFFSSLYFQSLNFDLLETYFCFLGTASENRDASNEAVFKVEYANYSNLTELEISLEELLN
jgi:hypothetical protein